MKTSPAPGISAPFSRWPRGRLQLLCALFVVASLACARFLMQLGEPIDARLPYGILSVEAPWSSSGAERVNELLEKDGIAAARKQTHYDFAFLVLYSLALSLACTLVARASIGRLQVLGAVFAWTALAAGAFDAIENLAVLRLLDGQTGAPWPQISTACAIAKFSLLLGVSICLAVGLARLGLQRLRKLWPAAPGGERPKPLPTHATLTPRSAPPASPAASGRWCGRDR